MVVLHRIRYNLGHRPWTVDFVSACGLLLWGLFVVFHRKPLDHFPAYGWTTTFPQWVFVVYTLAVGAMQVGFALFNWKYARKATAFAAAYFYATTLMGTVSVYGTTLGAFSGYGALFFANALIVLRTL